MKEWLSEPDRVQWVDVPSGLDCLIVRNQFGALCGYVGVSRAHPFFAEPYDGLVLEVHQGLTYSGLCNGEICHVPEPGRPEEIWWFGFDCGHCTDVLPKTIVPAFPSATYKNLAFVQRQCAYLAEQLRRAG